MSEKWLNRIKLGLSLSPFWTFNCYIICKDIAVSLVLVGLIYWPILVVGYCFLDYFDNINFERRKLQDTLEELNTAIHELEGKVNSEDKQELDD